jgi:transposase-like protein
MSFQGVFADPGKMRLQRFEQMSAAADFLGNGAIEIKYHKAVECLIKDRDALLTFYDFPAEQWKHLRTTNVIDVRNRASPHRALKGMSLKQDRARPDLQTRRGRRTNLASSRRSQSNPPGKVQ